VRAVGLFLMAAIRELDVEAFLRTRLRTIVAGPRRVVWSGLPRFGPGLART
jgi:hypothetical protein